MAMPLSAPNLNLLRPCLFRYWSIGRIAFIAAYTFVGEPFFHFLFAEAQRFTPPTDFVRLRLTTGISARHYKNSRPRNNLRHEGSDGSTTQRTLDLIKHIMAAALIWSPNAQNHNFGTPEHPETSVTNLNSLAVSVSR